MGEKGCLAKNLYKRLSSQTTVPEKWLKEDNGKTGLKDMKTRCQFVQHICLFCVVPDTSENLFSGSVFLAYIGRRGVEVLACVGTEEAQTWESHVVGDFFDSL